MRLLDVSPVDVWPPLRGSAQRTHNLLTGLSGDHEVRQFCLRRDGGPFLERGLEERDVPGGYRRWKLAHPAAAAALMAGTRTWPRAPIGSGPALGLLRPAALGTLLRWADAVLVSFPWQFGYCARHAAGARLVYASMNVEARKFRSWAKAAGSPLSSPAWTTWIERVERDAVRRADLVLAVSPDDARGFVDDLGASPERVAVVPNGADTDRIVPAGVERRRAAKLRLGLDPEQPVALFLGDEIAPNRRGLEWTEELARSVDAYRFVAAGRVSHHVREPRVRALGVVEDLELLLACADISLCPIEHGGGTKTKLLDSMAAGLPVVAFPHALVGLEAEAGRHLLVTEPRAPALREAVERLACDPELARRIGAAGRELVVDRYSWPQIAQALDGRLRELVADGAVA